MGEARALQVSTCCEHECERPTEAAANSLLHSARWPQPGFSSGSAQRHLHRAPHQLPRTWPTNNKNNRLHHKNNCVKVAKWVRSLRWANSNPITDPLQCQVRKDFYWNAHWSRSRSAHKGGDWLTFHFYLCPLFLKGWENPSLAGAKNKREKYFSRLVFDFVLSTGWKWRREKMRLFLSRGAV